MRTVKGESNCPPPPPLKSTQSEHFHNDSLLDGIKISGRNFDFYDAFPMDGVARPCDINDMRNKEVHTYRTRLKV